MAADPGPLPTDPDEPGRLGWSEIAERQCNVIAVRTALFTGLSRSEMRWRLTRGSWQRPMRGVLVTHSGPVTRTQLMWCALESVGPSAVLAGASAAELDGLKGHTDKRIFILLPADRQPGRRPGVVIRRSTRLGSFDVHPRRFPLRTRPPRSAIDMASWAYEDDDARAVLAAAVQQGLVTVADLRTHLERAGPLRRRSLISATLDDLAGGSRSLAEILYRQIEKRFGLPSGERQAPAVLGGRQRFLDVWYEPWRVWVEIDGGHHREVSQWWADLARQNDGVLDDRLILRFPTHLLRSCPQDVGPAGGCSAAPTGLAGTTIMILVAEGSSRRPRSHKNQGRPGHGALGRCKPSHTGSRPMDDQPAMDATVPHSARVWNYWLGGSDNYPVDRAAGDQIREIFPEVVDVAREARAFLARAVRYLAGDAGIRQFLDVGAGLPTADNTHEIAQRVAPESRVVYADHDPLVLAHARALLTSTPEGATAYLDADVRDPGKIVDGAARTLDLTRPVALMLLGVLGHIADVNEAQSIVSRLLDPLPSGSYLVLNDGTSSPKRKDAEARYSDSGGVPYHSRSPEQIARFFDGLELVEPGVVSTPLWRPEPGAAPRALDEFCGVGRKP